MIKVRRQHHHGTSERAKRMRMRMRGQSERSKEDSSGHATIQEVSILHHVRDWGLGHLLETLFYAHVVTLADTQFKKASSTNTGCFNDVSIFSNRTQGE
jgi:hypothetical protein